MWTTGNVSSCRKRQVIGKLTAPVLLVVVLRGKDLAARDKADSPCDAVDDGVGHDTSDETVGNRVGKWHEHEGDESGDGVAGVVPVDGENTAHHHAAHKNERAAGCPRWDGCENRCEEKGDKEEHTSCHCGQASATTFLDTSLYSELDQTLQV